MEIAPDTAFVIACCIFWGGVIIGPFVWDAIRTYTWKGNAPTAEEKEIGKRMEREYRQRMKDVQRGHHA